jgi:hypothetical protein
MLNFKSHMNEPLNESALTALRVATKAHKEYIPKTIKEDTAELRKKYQNQINAEEKLSDHDYRVNRARVTRTANTLSKAINKHLGPNATIQDKINLRTRLQNGK